MGILQYHHLILRSSDYVSQFLSKILIAALRLCKLRGYTEENRQSVVNLKILICYKGIRYKYEEVNTQTLEVQIFNKDILQNGWTCYKDIH